MASRARRSREVVIQTRLQRRREPLIARGLSTEIRKAYLASASAMRAGRDPLAFESAHSKAVNKVLSRSLISVGTFFGQRILARVPKKESVFERVFREWALRYSARRARAISQTTRKVIARIIAAADKLGLSTDEVADRIEQKAKVSDVRAAVIARTEVHTVANVAQDQAVRTTRLKMKKQWGSTADERTRPTHNSADGQIRDMDKKFRVGGSFLMFPGDPEGPAKEIINCRCAVLYLPVGRDGQVINPAS